MSQNQMLCGGYFEIMIFGNKSEFAVEFFETRDGLDRANIFIAGRNITPVDNCHYNLAGNLSLEAICFANSASRLRNASDFPKESVEAVFFHINESELRFTYRVFDWGPPTDDCFFVLVPFNEKLYLYGELDGIYTPFGLEIEPFNIANTLMQAAKHITSVAT